MVQLFKSQLNGQKLLGLSVPFLCLGKEATPICLSPENLSY